MPHGISVDSPVPDTAQQIRLRLNDAELAVSAPLTLEQLLAQQLIDAAAHATAVNGVFVPRSARASHAMHAGDVVLCFQAIVGG